MLKKFVLFICILLALFMCVSCNNDTPGEGESDKIEVVPLTDDEAELLEAIGEDIQVVSDENYSNAVVELQYHTNEFVGQVYQLEGVIKTTTINGVETRFVYRNLNNNGEITECGLPIKFLEKDIADGNWVRVTAIIGVEDFGGVAHTVMEVVAIEVPAKAGKAELEWSGSQHNH